MARSDPAGDKKPSRLKRLFGKSGSSKRAQDERLAPPEYSSRETSRQTEPAQPTLSWSSSPSGYNYTTAAKPYPAFGITNSNNKEEKDNRCAARNASVPSNNKEEKDNRWAARNSSDPSGNKEEEDKLWGV
jgi:hypothetical protein